MEASHDRAPGQDRRRLDEFTELGRRIDERTRVGRWDVDTGRAPCVRTAEGTIDLKPAAVTARSGTNRVEIRSHSFLLVGRRWSQTLLREVSPSLFFAALTHSDVRLCRFDLLPPTVIWNRPQPLLEAQPWTARLRQLSPLSHRRTDLQGLAAAYDVVDRQGHVLLAETRRYEKPAGPGQRNPIAEWTITLVDNPFPDLWVLSLIMATMGSALPRSA